MSYHIYTTRAIVLSSKTRREADKVYSILARDLGLIRAVAGGVRKEQSKLRSSLEPFSVSQISFVRGKDYWRITNVEPQLILTNIYRDDRSRLTSIARTFSLVEKLVVGESVHPELFDKIEEIINFSIKNNTEEEETEILFAANILSKLGYISNDSLLESIVTAELRTEVISIIKQNKRKVIGVVNKRIKESGLI